METKRSESEREGKDAANRRENKMKRVESKVRKQIQNLVLVSPGEKVDGKKFEDGPSLRSVNPSSVPISTVVGSDAGRKTLRKKNPKKRGISAAAKKIVDKGKAKQRLQKVGPIALEKRIQKRKAKAVKQSAVSVACEQLVPLAVQAWLAQKKNAKKDEKASRRDAKSTLSISSLPAPTSGLNRDWKQAKHLVNVPVYTGRKGTNRGFDEGYDFLPPQPPPTVIRGRSTTFSGGSRSITYAGRDRSTTSVGRGRRTHNN
ncbi:unnamed protein product [Orchesella dallaii]|uniref:Uncharacterized protein n=1 Tax=Orchesella dallaii TaxID=48710 RepID=A0ABP1SAW4_9HEXA